MASKVRMVMVMLMVFTSVDDDDLISIRRMVIIVMDMVEELVIYFACGWVIILMLTKLCVQDLDG